MEKVKHVLSFSLKLVIRKAYRKTKGQFKCELSHYLGNTGYDGCP